MAGLETMRGAIRGAVFAPGDAGYDEARAVWNAMIDRRPKVIVRCADRADVVTAVRYAAAENLPISVRGGAHNVAGFAAGDDSVMIDLSMMRGVTVDASLRRARVAGGAT